MLFGTHIGWAPGSVGVAPGTLTMQLGDPRIMNCPPDPVWNYFPSPFTPYTYAQAPEGNPPCIPAPPINITPPNFETDPQRPSGNSKPPVLTTTPTTSRPTTTTQSEPNRPRLDGCADCGIITPYADPIRLSGLRGLGSTPGPFGMTWAGFLGVVGVALAGGVGLGYLSKR